MDKKQRKPAPAPKPERTDAEHEAVMRDVIARIGTLSAGTLDTLVRESAAALATPEAQRALERARMYGLPLHTGQFGRTQLVHDAAAAELSRRLLQVN